MTICVYECRPWTTSTWLFVFHYKQFLNKKQIERVHKSELVEFDTPKVWLAIVIFKIYLCLHTESIELLDKQKLEWIHKFELVGLVPRMTYMSNTNIHKSPILTNTRNNHNNKIYLVRTWRSWHRWIKIVDQQVRIWWRHDLSFNLSSSSVLKF